MEQSELRLMCRLDGPSIAPTSYVRSCKSYREAVRMAWGLRRIRNMTRRSMAELGGFYAPHVSDWLNPDDKASRRDLPGNCIPEFEAVVGNTLVSQWLASKAKFTVLEEIQADKEVA